MASAKQSAAGHPLLHALIDPTTPIEVLALLVANDEYPALSIATWGEKLDFLAGPLLDGSLGRREPTHQADALRRRVYEELGFKGNDREYYDPRNSYLNEV